MKRILLLMLTILILAACSSSPKADLSGDWRLVSYGDAANPTPALPGVDTLVTFEKGQFGGNLGCNSFGGDYTLSDDTIAFGPVRSTKMFCEQTFAQEQAVFEILGNGGALAIHASDGLLTITSPDGVSMVTLARK